MLRVRAPSPAVPQGAADFCLPSLFPVADNDCRESGERLTIARSSRASAPVRTDSPARCWCCCWCSGLSQVVGLSSYVPTALAATAGVLPIQGNRSIAAPINCWSPHSIGQDLSRPWQGDPVLRTRSGVTTALADSPRYPSVPRFSAHSRNCRHRTRVRMGLRLQLGRISSVGR